MTFDILLAETMDREMNAKALRFSQLPHHDARSSHFKVSGSGPIDFDGSIVLDQSLFL